MSDKPTLLIVDDDSVLREIIASAFECDGYKVHQAPNGRAAFDCAVANAIDVVVSDIRMPGGDGVELLKRLRERSAETPVIILITGHADFSVEEAYDFGADAVLTKPFERRVLEAAILNLREPKDVLWARNCADQHRDISLEFVSVDGASKEGRLSFGRGGMYVTLNHAGLRVGETLSFEIKFSKDPLLSCLKGAGVARWLRPIDPAEKTWAIGLEFVCIDAESRGSLTALIGHLQPRAFIPKIARGEGNTSC